MKKKLNLNKKITNLQVQFWNIIQELKEEFLPVRRFDLYIFSEFIKIFIGTSILLTSILMVSMIMDNMKNFIESTQNTVHIYLFILYSLPGNVSWVLSPALMFASSFTIAQFSVNKELLSMMVAGISFLRIVSTLLVFGILISVFSFILNELVVRPANKLAQNEKSIVMEGIGTLKDLVYQYHVKGKEGFYYLYYYDHKAKIVKGGFNYIKILNSGKVDFIVSANRAEYDVLKKIWRLYNIEELIFNDDLKITNYIKSPEKEYNLPESPEYFEKPSISTDEMNLFELSKEINERIKKGVPYTDLMVARHSLFALPLMNIIVTIIGCISGSVTKKTAGVASLGITIIVVLVYYILFSIGKAMGESGVLFPSVAVWVTPFLFLGLCVYIYRKFNI